MAQSKRPRPLSPHLQVYRWGPHMLASILHRATGIGLALGGSALLLYWLGSAAAGPQSYESFHQLISSWPGKLFLFALTWGVFQHMMGGLRHFYMDAGHGYDLAANRRISILSFIAAIVLTLLVWAVALFT
jgi:succinate dehydrogenase / fumarate reductase, cytochrome b subunit